MKEVLMIIGITVAYSFVSTGDYLDEKEEATHYCAMVNSWVRHQGTRGHPNYDDRDCSWYESL